MMPLVGGCTEHGRSERSDPSSAGFTNLRPLERPITLPCIPSGVQRAGYSSYQERKGEDQPFEGSSNQAVDWLIFNDTFRAML